MADEYIKRQDLLEKLNQEACDCEFMRLLSDIPAADVAPVVHGRWIRRGNEKKCSECGFIYYSNHDEWNGCPNCLARMDGVG